MADGMREYTPDEEGYEQSLEDLEAIEPAPKPSYSKAVVLVNFVLIIAFTVVQLVFLWNGKPLNDTLTRCFFGCFGFEFGCLAFTHRSKLKYSGGNAANSQMPHIELEEEEEDDERRTGKKDE
jgi:hypothetical protein